MPEIFAGVFDTCLSRKWSRSQMEFLVGSFAAFFHSLQLTPDLRNMNAVKYEIHPLAQAEYEDHLLYYAANGFTITTLEDFRTELDAAFEKIVLNPFTYRLTTKTGKRRRFGPTKRFKFIIYYTIRGDGVTPYILAVTHPSRKPNYWARRN